MFHWSVLQLRSFFNNPAVLYASVVVASLNMSIQIMFDLMFGDKSVMRIGGKR